MDINIFEIAGILRDERIQASTRPSDANYKNEGFDNITDKLCTFMDKQQQQDFKVVSLYRKPVDNAVEHCPTD
jgi:hypothetical protein